MQLRGLRIKLSGPEASATTSRTVQDPRLRRIRRHNAVRLHSGLLPLPHRRLDRTKRRLK